MYIAAIPLDQKQSVVQTQNDWSIAKMEQAKAEADQNEAKTQQTIARNALKQTQLSIDNAVAAKKAADASADTNRINQAVKDLHTAEDQKKAAEARVHYLDAYIGYMNRYVRYTQENTFWRESQYEAAKAKLAQGNNIAPKGVNYTDFPSQLEQRGKRTQGAKERAERDKQHTVDQRNAWLSIQKQADTESGQTTTVWDPMMSKGSVAGPTPTDVKPIEQPKSGPVETKPMPKEGEGSGSATPQ
jgi:colicin import membrane protein